MLDNLQRLKTAADNIRHGVQRAIGSADVEAKNLSVLIGELDDYAEENMQSADNLDKQLNSIDDVVESKVREAYSKLIETSYDITLAMQTNGTKLSNTTSETLNTRTFNGDADILIIPANMPIYAANANTKSMQECFRGSSVQIIYDLPDMADVTNAMSICHQAVALTDIDTHSWFTRSGKITNIYRMFMSDANINIIDARTWDLSNVTNAQETFSGCLKAKILLPDTDSGDPQAVQGTGADNEHWKKLYLPLCTAARSVLYATNVPKNLYIVVGNGAQIAGIVACATNTTNYTAAAYSALFDNGLKKLYIDCSNINMLANENTNGGIANCCRSLTEVNLVSTANLNSARCMFCNCRNLITITGLDFSGIALSVSELTAVNASARTEYFASEVANIFFRCDSLVNCEITGTIYKSGIDLRHSASLSKASFVSFLTALYEDWSDVNAPTTDDTEHRIIFAMGTADYLEDEDVLALFETKDIETNANGWIIEFVS